MQTEPNAAALPPDGAASALQDPDAILAVAVRVLGRLLDAHPDVRGIGITGQMHGILYVDRAGRAVSPLYTWQDARGDLPHPDGSTYAEVLSRETGCRLSTGMGLVSHACNAREGRIPAGAAALCTIADYAAMRLARSTVPMMDTTNAASLGCFDVERLAFRLDALQRAGHRRRPPAPCRGGLPGARRGAPGSARVRGARRQPGELHRLGPGQTGHGSRERRHRKPALRVDGRPVPGARHRRAAVPVRRLSRGRRRALRRTGLRPAARVLRAHRPPVRGCGGRTRHGGR